MMDNVVGLISHTYTTDSFGVQQALYEITREVFCQVQTVSRAEFFAGMQMGLRPDYVVRLHPVEYDGETLAEYQGDRYAIYRVYRASPDVMELYLHREVGVQHDI